MKTELVWEGKYDEYGRRRPVALPSFPLVMQRIETVDEPRDAARARATRQGDLFDPAAFTRSSHRDDFRNRLIWGDNKLALAALLEEFRGQVKLVYIDPPFDVGADFSMDIEIGGGGGGSTVPKQASVLEEVAYRDTWGNGSDSFLAMICERLDLIRELIAPDGIIYVHCDWRLAASLRLTLNDVFGTERFLNEVIWAYGASARGAKAKARQFARNHDSILVFSRSSSWAFNGDILRRPYTPEQAKSVGFRQDNEGRWFKTAPRGDYTDDSIDLLRSQGRVYETRTGGIRIKYFLECDGDRIVEPVPVGDTWTDIPDGMHLPDSEVTGYETQKPEKLLARVLRASSNDRDLVLDCFCGSGTTLAVAEKLGRRWIGVDLGRYAIHTTRKRLIGVQRELHAAQLPYRSFDLYNLGRYERQWWQQDRLKGADESHRAAVLKFFRAQPLPNPPSPLLHATRAGAYVHVDAIDSILTLDELREVAAAVTAAGGRRLICLAWEFEMDLRLRMRAVVAETGLDLQLKYIPREIMESNRTELQFFDAAALEAELFATTEDGKTTWDVRLLNFLPSLTEVPEKELEALRERAVRSPFDFVDFWAVDFAHRDGKPFEHHWQDFRTRKDRSLRTVSNAKWKYDGRGPHRACVKVIDVFGIDTTTVVEVGA